jgi:hypothetical protein
MNLLLNYDYDSYPYTTASYLEMAAKEIKDIKVLRCDPDLQDKPDLIINVMPFDQMYVYPGIPSCYWEIDCHIIQGKKTSYYDMVDRVYIAQEPFLRLYPPGKTFYLPLGCDPDLHKRFPDEPRLYDIGFIGNSTYPERSKLLEQLATKYKVLRTNSPPGIPYSKLLSQCDLIFNRSLLFDVNMRFFEALAIGRLLLTDYLPAQDKIAEVNKHYQIFSDWHDLDSKVAYYLKNSDERERIALAGVKQVTENHTYKHRLGSILHDFGWMFETDYQGTKLVKNG